MNPVTNAIINVANHHLSEFVYIKDECSRYVYANEWFLSFYGMTCLEQIYHKTDYDLPWEKYAGQYITHDNEAIAIGELQVIEPTLAPKGNEVLILSHKYAFHDPETKQSGMMGISRMICENAMKAVLPAIGHQHASALKFSGHLFNIKVNEHASIPLTGRELDVLYYILHGLSQKQVADKLKLSVRTVESYVDPIKAKLKCGNKHQLFEFAIRHGLMNIIPKNL